jgi:hypothetical protein
MSVRRAALVLLLIVPLLLTAQQLAPQNDSIRKEDMKADLYFLAHDLTQGRLVGTPGNALAAEFIKSRFERLGLVPAGPDGSFFQSFNLEIASIGPDNGLEVVDSDQVATRRQSGQDYYPLKFSASARVKGPVVFAGFGITSPALSYDDYRGESVKGKIALILDHEPGERDPASPFDGVVTAEAAVPFRKVLAAQEKGAIGVLFVSDVQPSRRAELRGGGAGLLAASRRGSSSSPSDYIDRIRIPAAQISPALASILIRGTNRTLEDLCALRSRRRVPDGPLAILGRRSR